MTFLKAISLCLLSITFVFTASAQAQPETPQKDHELKFHDTIVNDPYAWLEKTNKSKVEQWYREQTDYANMKLSANPERDVILNKLEEISDAYSTDIQAMNYRNGRYFYFKQEKNDEQKKLYYTDGIDGEEKLIFDPASLNEDGNIYNLMWYSPSFNAKYVTLTLSPNGSELPEFFIYDLEKGALLPEKMDFAYGYAHRWLTSDEGFTYIRYPKVKRKKLRDAFKTGELYYHKVGTSFEEDRLIISKEHYPELVTSQLFSPTIYHAFESPYMFLLMRSSVSKDLVSYYALQKDLFSDHIEWKQWSKLEDGVKNYYAIGSELFAIVGKNTANNKFVKLNLEMPEKGFEQVIPETSEELFDVAPKKHGLYAMYKNGPYSILYWLPDNNPEKRVKVKLPFNGRLRWSGFYDISDRLLFSLESYANQKRYYIHEVSEDIIVEADFQSQNKNFRDIDIKTNLVYAKAEDGTSIPITLIYYENLKLDGTNPLLITAYGAYGTTMQAAFNPAFQLISDLKAVFAIAHVRGGGFYGEEWHKAGAQDKKPNTWNDLISCTEYLFDQGYSVSEKTTALGGSAGGIAVGRAMTERPDLFKAVISQVGYLNTANFYESSAEIAEVSEFGDIKNPDHFRFKFEMDSYFHVKKGVNYPSVLLTAGWNDRRVPAWQAGKMAAMLQNCTTNDNPVLLQVDFKGGHMGATTKSSQISTMADLVTFFLWQTDCLNRINSIE